MYAATKLHQEKLCSAFVREHVVSVSALRCHNVYGPRMPHDTPYAGVARLFWSRLAAGQPPLVFEDGGQTRDFVHVHDVAQANVRALTAPIAHDGALNIASGHPVMVLEMASAIAGGSAPELSPVVTGAYRLGDVRHAVASPQRASRGPRLPRRDRADGGTRRVRRRVTTAAAHWCRGARPPR